MKKQFLTTCLLTLLFGCSAFQEMPHILDHDLTIKDKELLSFLRTTMLKNIEIQASDLPEAMNLLNMHISKELGYPNGVSYVIRSNEIKSLTSDPFATSASSIHFIGNLVSIRIDNASLEKILMTMALQSGYKVRLSNGIVFY